MTTTEIINKALSVRKGSQQLLRSFKSVELSAFGKKNGFNVTKYTEKLVRFGIKYENTQEGKEAIASGEYTGKLPWGAWGIERYTIENKGKTYLRYYKSINKKQKPKSIYYLDGKEIDKDELITLGIVNRSTIYPSGNPKCFTENVENILSIGRA